MGATASPSGLRISLREFLLLITAVVIACAALKLANEYWLITVSLATLLVFIAAAIVAIVDRGSRQVFAIGFIVAGVVYGGFLSGFGPKDERLPTTRLLSPVYGLVAVTWYWDLAAKRSISESELPPGAKIHYGGGGGGGFGGAVLPPPPTTGFAYSEQLPYHEHFMTIGHCLWALLLGYAGGHFARWVYHRRLRQQNAAS